MSTGIDMSVTPLRLAALPLSRDELQLLRFVESSARVKRWHTEPTLHTQTVGEHTYGVMQLVWLLTGGKASRSLLVAAMMHDTAERKFGDVPGPTKRLLGVKGTFDELEAGFMQDVGLNIPLLTTAEEGVLKMADNLEGGMFCAFELRRGNREIREGFFNYLSYIRAMPDHTELSAAIYNQLLKEYVDVFGE